MPSRHFEPDLDSFKALYDSKDSRKHFAKVTHDLLSETQERKSANTNSADADVSDTLTYRESRRVIRKLEKHALGYNVAKPTWVGYNVPRRLPADLSSLQRRAALTAASMRRAYLQRRYSDAVEYQILVAEIAAEMQKLLGL